MWEAADGVFEMYLAFFERHRSRFPGYNHKDLLKVILHHFEVSFMSRHMIDPDINLKTEDSKIDGLTDNYHFENGDRERKGNRWKTTETNNAIMPSGIRQIVLDEDSSPSSRSFKSPSDPPPPPPPLDLLGGQLPVDPITSSWSFAPPSNTPPSIAAVPGFKFEIESNPDIDPTPLHLPEPNNVTQAPPETSPSTNQLKPYECCFCGCRFTSRNAKARHELHSHSTRRPHSCPLCGRAFKRREHVRVHCEQVHGPRSNSKRRRRNFDGLMNTSDEMLSNQAQHQMVSAPSSLPLPPS